MIMMMILIDCEVCGIKNSTSNLLHEIWIMLNFIYSV